LEAGIDEEVAVEGSLEVGDLAGDVPVSTEQLAQSGLWRVDDTTYFAMALSRSARGPVRDGQWAAKNS
jgi:hypothetical protein